MASEKASQTLPIGKGYKLRSKEREYEIVAVLGSGSFGITYLAKAKVSVGNISTTMSFAIKEHFISASCYRGEDGATVLTVPTAKSDVVDSRADFITEANRLKKLCLKSRNIVSVNETFEANGTAYYVMEYLDGGSPSKCPEKDAVSIVMQVAEALDEIHKEHVLHLDLKPDNIVLKTNERKETYPVLIDFGISKHFDSKGRPTSSLSAKGASPGYAPQEQYAGVNEFSPKYDIYALGAVLFYLCTGKNPPDAFKISPNQQELRRELTGKVSANVEKAILNAMKPSAMERTPDIQRFRDDLMGIDFIPVLNPSTSIVEFSHDKGQHTVSVDSNIGWAVYSDGDWCKATKINNDIAISVSRNKGPGSRACKISIHGAPYQISQIIRIKQEGPRTEVFPKEPTWWKRNSRKVYQAGGVILVGFMIAGICSIFKIDPEKESLRLTKAIESSDLNTLKEFADYDSIRAFKPLIRELKKTNLDQAKYYATKYASLDSIDYLIPMSEIYLKEGDYTKAKSYVDKFLVFNPNDSSIRSLQQDLENHLQQIQQEENNINTHGDNITNEKENQNQVPTNETDDEKFARASHDFNLMLSLAKNNYAKAYYPLAEMYYGKKDIANAKRWAQKSINANVNRSKATDLLKRITSSSHNQTLPEPVSDSSVSVGSHTQDMEKQLQEALKDPVKGITTICRLALTEHYAPSYYPYAKQLLKGGRTDEAKKYLKLSIENGSNVSQAKQLLESLEE